MKFVDPTGLWSYVTHQMGDNPDIGTVEKNENYVKDDNSDSIINSYLDGSVQDNRGRNGEGTIKHPGERIGSVFYFLDGIIDIDSKFPQRGEVYFATAHYYISVSKVYRLMMINKDKEVSFLYYYEFEKEYGDRGLISSSTRRFKSCFLPIHIPDGAKKLDTLSVEDFAYYVDYYINILPVDFISGPATFLTPMGSLLRGDGSKYENIIRMLVTDE